MKQVKEFISYEKGFFSTFAEQRQADFITLFGDENYHIDGDMAAKLDMDLVVTCGERYASPLLIHYDMSKVVDYVLNRYLEGWKRIKEALTAEYNVVTPYDTKKVTTQEKTATSATTGTVTDKTGVVAFDSEEPTDKSVDSSVNEGNRNDSETVRITVENTGMNGNVPVASLISNEIEVRKNSLISIVIGDVENQLTLDIY